MEFSSQKEFFEEAFADKNFSKISLSHSEFEDCHFLRCQLSEANLNLSTFLHCTFEDCDFSNVKIQGAKWRDLKFLRCKLMGIQWPQASDLVNPEFEHCNLSFSNFVELKLKKTKFDHCLLREADLAQADFTESYFQYCDFLGARFHETNLIKSDLRNALNYSIIPQQNKLKGARFSWPEAQGLLTGLGIILEN